MTTPFPYKAIFKNPFSEGNLRLLWWIAAGWFLIWALVGIFVITLDLDVPGGGSADFLFLILASVVIFLETLRLQGWKWSMGSFLWIAVFSGLVEYIGATTGWPFGNYTYTPAFGPQLVGILPLSIPLAWWVVIMPLYGLARSRARLGPVSTWVLIPFFVASSAVWVDLLLEPVAWLKRGYWLWEATGLYYGVPSQNFAGWFGTAAILTHGLLLAEVLTGKKILRPTPFSPRALTVLVVVLVTFALGALVGGYWLGALFGVLLIIFLGGSVLFPVPVSPVEESPETCK